MKLIKLILIFLLLTQYCSLKTFGTAQIPDILIYNNDTVPIFANPLEQLDNIDTLREKLFGKKKNGWYTACYRNYQAEWTLIDSQLYLIGIYSCSYDNDSIKADLQSLFGDKFLNGKVKADWVSSNLLSPQGKELYYVHAGYGSLYEKEVVFEIEGGRLKSTTVYDNSKSKQSVYSEGSTLITFIHANINWEALPKQDQTIKIVVKFSANENGIIDRTEVVKGEDDIFNNEAMRVVKSIPEWDVFYRLGQFERRARYAIVIFSEENKNKYCQD